MSLQPEQAELATYWVSDLKSVRSHPVGILRVTGVTGGHWGVWNAVGALDAKLCWYLLKAK